MEFGSFDDDLFGVDENVESKNNKTIIDNSYSPKMEFSCWFGLDSPSESDGVEIDSDFLDKERMRAAYFYWRGDYEKAARSYELLLEKTSSSLLRLEFSESYARALIACDRSDDAERIAIDFFRRAINYDQQAQSLNLLSDTYWRRRDYKKCLVASACLAFLIDGGNPDLWYRIGHCFINWSNTEEGNIDQKSDDLIDSRRLSIIDTDSANLPRLFSKCLRRAYDLYSLTYATSVGYARERNEKMRLRIESDLKSIIDVEKNETINLGDNESGAIKIGEMENGENENEADDEDQRSSRRDLDKMIDVDLVGVFEQFFKKWLT